MSKTRKIKTAQQGHVQSRSCKRQNAAIGKLKQDKPGTIYFCSIWPENGQQTQSISQI